MSKLDALNQRIKELEEEVAWLHRERREVYAERDKLEFLLTPSKFQQPDPGFYAETNAYVVPRNPKHQLKNKNKGRYHSSYDN